MSRSGLQGALAGASATELGAAEERDAPAVDPRAGSADRATVAWVGGQLLTRGSVANQSAIGSWKPVKQ